jgi:hypothetical protein
MVRAGLLEHFVEDGPLRRASRLFALNGDDEIIVESLPLDRSHFLLLLALLGPSTRAHIIVHWRLPLAALMVEEGNDGFLTSSIVCHHIHQLVDSLWSLST